MSIKNRLEKQKHFENLKLKFEILKNNDEVHIHENEKRTKGK